MLSLIMITFSINAESKAKKAKFGYLFFEAENDWVKQDSIVSIGVNIGEGGGWNNFVPVGCVCIRNITDDVIYVDMGQCFISRNGKSQSLWDNSQIVKTMGESHGGSVNLGGIANAIGIGGSLGSLAGAVTLGSNSNASTSVITQNEKIIAIAPLSHHTIIVPLLPERSALPNFTICKTTGWNNNRIDGATLILTDLYAGQIINYTLDTSPIQISFFVKYSDKPDFSEPQKYRLNFYVCEMIGTRKTYWDGDKAVKELQKYGKSDINPYFRCMPFYVDKNWPY